MPRRLGVNGGGAMFEIVAWVGCFVLWLSGSQAAQPGGGTIERGNFRFVYDERGVSGLANPHDPFRATLVPIATRSDSGRPPRAGAASATLGLTVTYRVGNGAWTTIPRGTISAALPADGKVTYTTVTPSPLKVTETYQTDGRVLDWTIDLANKGASAVQIGDLSVSIPAAGPVGENPIQIFERGFLRHQFVSGHGSFIYFLRASGAPPFLLVTVRPGTHLEYTAGGGGRSGANLFVHSPRRPKRVAPGVRPTRRSPSRPEGSGAARRPTAFACSGPTATTICARCSTRRGSSTSASPPA
jgi:hypothetical protein